MATQKKKTRRPYKKKAKVQEIVSPGAEEEIKLPLSMATFDEEETIVEVKEVESVVQEESFVSEIVQLLPTNRRFANLINLYGDRWETAYDFRNEGSNKILIENNTQGYRVIARVQEEDIERGISDD